LICCIYVCNKLSENFIECVCVCGGGGGGSKNNNYKKKKNGEKQMSGSHV